MPSWPVGLPDFVLRENYSEGFRNVMLRSQMDGAAKRRRRWTTAPKPMSYVVPLTSDERDVFESFFDDDLEGGTLSFTRDNPRTGATETFAFTKTPEPPVVDGHDSYLLTLDLEQLT